jgi:transketolase C-terminal domain/subunit
VSNAQKLIDAMANNPLDWTLDQVKTVAKASGLTVHCPGGSHHVVRNAAGAKISVPAHRPIKAICIKKLIRLIQTGKGENE